MRNNRVNQRPLHCSNSITSGSSAFYKRMNESRFFYHLKSAFVRAHSPLRTQNGGPPGAEVAHIQLMWLPTYRLNQHRFFFSSSMVEAGSHVHHPTCGLNTTRSFHGNTCLVFAPSDTRRRESYFSETQVFVFEGRWKLEVSKNNRL